MAPPGPGGWRRASPLLLLAVVLALLGRAQGQQCLPSADSELLQFPDLGASFSVPVQAADEPGAWKPLYSTVLRFLDAVKPNSFPSDLLRDVLNNASFIHPAQVVKYATGYVVCAVLAGLYLVLMVLTGLIFFICRCCGRCGGKIQCFKKNLTCRRNSLILALLLTTVLMLAGLICAFAANEKTTQAVESSARAIPASLQGFRTSLANIPQAVQTLVSEFSVPKHKVIEDLHTVGRTIGNSISSKLSVTVYPLLVNVTKTAQDLQSMVQNLQDLQNSTVRLQQRQEELETGLSDQRQNLSEVLNKATCVSCAETLSQVLSLSLEANFSQIPSVADVLSRVEGGTDVNMSAILQMAMESFQDIPSIVEQKSVQGVKDSLEALNSAEAAVQSLAAEFQMQRYSAPLSAALAVAENQSSEYGEEATSYEHYRWLVGIILCCVVLFIIACNFLGLLLGLWGLYLRADVTEETTLGETGAAILMSGAGLSFLFSWLLILLVFATFLIGGSVQTLVCKSWADGSLYKFLDEPGNLPPSLNLCRSLSLRGDLNISGIYQRCRAGAVFWDILQLNQSVDIGEALNISKYSADFHKNIVNVTIDLQEFSAMEAIARLWFGEFNGSGIDQIDYSLFKAQIQAPLLKTSLEGFAAQLETLVANQSDSTIRSQLREVAAALRALQASVVEAQAADVRRMDGSLRGLAAIAPTAQARADSALADLGHMETFLAVDAQKLLKKELQCFIHKELGYFGQYVDWVNRTITQQVASCRPVSTLLDNARIALCENVVRPWNAFWFSLGWCTFLLIPSIIFAVKTSKYFRPVQQRLSFHYAEDESLYMIPRVTSVDL